MYSGEGDDSKAGAMYKAEDDVTKAGVMYKAEGDVTKAGVMYKVKVMIQRRSKVGEGVGKGDECITRGKC